MPTPIQINNPEEEEMVEISRAEYEAIKALAPAIAEQNAAVLKSIDALRGEMVAQAETQTANMGAFLDALKDAFAGMQITVNVPEQPAPVVNITAADQPAPIVNVQMPDQPAPVVNFTAPEPKAQIVKVKRGKNGFADEYIIK